MKTSNLYLFIFFFSAVVSLEDDIRCLQGIKSSLRDPQNRLASWSFTNPFNGFLCAFLGVSCWNPSENRLVGLQLKSMELGGEIPDSLQFCGSLQNLDLSDNSLSGSIPTQLCNWLPYLVTIDLSGNDLSGSIPAELVNCTYLNTLFLGDNRLSGSIPDSFKNLKKLLRLMHFNISFNNFDGEVPTQGIFQNAIGFSSVGNDKLCGGSPKLKLPKCYIFPKTLKVTIGVLVSLSVISTLLVLLALHRRKKSSVKSISRMYAHVLMLLALYMRKKSSAKSISRKYAHVHQRISYNEIREATEGFSSNNLIGKGNFASLYKGVLQEGETSIAVKIFNLMERGALKSFKVECDILREIRHRNLLKILTVCASTDFKGNDFKALILEFMPNGSLEDWLHTSSNRSQRSSRTLNHLQMLNIAIDVTFALDYLHNWNHIPIVHGDLKPSNVLLSEDLVTCVGDFGIAKFLRKSHCSDDKTETTSNAILGTVGYIPPEYGMGSSLSTKGDMYSYGIMLLEMFTGKRPTHEMFNDTLSLHNFCKVNLTKQDVVILNMIPLMEQSQNDTEEGRSMTWSMKKCLLSVIEIGVACSSEPVGDRMEIKDVLMKIQKIKEVFVKVMNPDENTNNEPQI